MTHNTTTTPTKVHKDAKLGVIPDGWTTPKISEVFQFINTTSFSRNQLNYDADNELFYIHYGDIHATYKKPLLDFDIETNIPKLNNDVVLPNSIQYLQDGDVIIADASEDYKGVGEAIEMKNLNGKKVISGLHTFALRDLNNKTVPGFRTYIFKNPNVKKALKTIATGSKVYGISKGNIQKFKIVLPPLPEQQKIAQILATWDMAINKQEAIIVEKQAFKKGLMQQLLTGKKRFAGFDKAWIMVKLAQVANIDQKNLKSNTDPNYSFRYISLSDISDGQISEALSVYKFKEAPSRAKRMLNLNSVIMATVRPNLQAFAIIKRETNDLIASTGFAVLDSKNNLSPDFLIQYLFSRHITSQIDSLIVGTNYPAINSSDVKNLKIKLPPIEEQQKIAEVLTASANEITVLQQKLQNLKNQKQGLMQQLLTGKIRVNV